MIFYFFNWFRIFGWVDECVLIKYFKDGGSCCVFFGYVGSKSFSFSKEVFIVN